MTNPDTKLPKRRGLVLAILVLVVFGGTVYGVYTLTLNRAVPELAKAKARLKTQRAEIKTLGARLESSQVKLKVAENEARVVRQANQLLREEESQRQAELQRLQGEIDFYSRLAGTSGAQSGLAVYHLELEPTNSARVFRFVLTLTQNLRRSAITSGGVQMDLEGTLRDRQLTIPWSKITDGSQPEPVFRFKYFQQLNGYLTVPDDFEPIRLRVTLKAKGQPKTVSRDFSWRELNDPSRTTAEPDGGFPAPAEVEKEPEREQDGR